MSKKYTLRRWCVVSWFVVKLKRIEGVFFCLFAADPPTKFAQSLSLLLFKVTFYIQLHTKLWPQLILWYFFNFICPISEHSNMLEEANTIQRNSPLKHLMSPTDSRLPGFDQLMWSYCDYWPPLLSIVCPHKPFVLNWNPPSSLYFLTSSPFSSPCT